MMQSRSILPFYFLLGFLLGLLCFTRPVLAQNDRTVLTVTLLDQNSQPLADVEITLILLRYGELAVETDAYAICTTDSAGGCTFTVSDPPRLADGHVEAWLDVENIGREWVSWQGDSLDVTLTVSDLQLQATVGAPNELGYEYETPGAYNSPVETRIPATPTPVVQAHLPEEQKQMQNGLPNPKGSRQPVSISILLCGLLLLAGVAFAAWRNPTSKRGQSR
jgi:hypothetical protein